MISSSGIVELDCEARLAGGKTLAFGASAAFSSDCCTNLTLRPAFTLDGFVKLGSSIAQRGREVWVRFTLRLADLLD